MKLIKIRVKHGKNRIKLSLPISEQHEQTFERLISEVKEFYDKVLKPSLKELNTTKIVEYLQKKKVLNPEKDLVVIECLTCGFSELSDHAIQRGLVIMCPKCKVKLAWDGLLPETYDPTESWKSYWKRIRDREERFKKALKLYKDKFDDGEISKEKLLEFKIEFNKKEGLLE